MFNALMNNLLDFYGKAYTRFKKIIKIFLTLVVVGLIVFAYLSNVEIDEGTEQMYKTLRVIFWCFVGLTPFALAAIGFWIYVYRRREEEYLKTHRKSKLNKHIYPFDVILFIVIGIFCLLCIYPIIYVVVGSFNQGADYAKGDVWFLPRVFTFENYRLVIQNEVFWRSYGITIARTVLGTLTALIFTSIVAYAMSRPNLKFKKVFYWINIFTMFFGGGLVPYFLIIKSIGLYNNFLVYIIPAMYSVYNMIVIQNGFKSISDDIHDAAMIDGAGEFRIYALIYMPLSKPVLATVVLWVAVGQWNSYFDTMIYTSDKNLHTLQYFLLQAVQTSSMTENLPPTMQEKLNPQTLSLAAIILSIIPVFGFFPLIRNNFASGIMIGSLKG